MYEAGSGSPPRRIDRLRWSDLPSNSSPGSAVTVSGFVTFVQFTAILNGSGTLVNVTVVTLQQTGLPQTFTFCGSQTSMFPLNQNMQREFYAGRNLRKHRGRSPPVICPVKCKKTRPLSAGPH